MSFYTNFYTYIRNRWIKPKPVTKPVTPTVPTTPTTPTNPVTPPVTPPTTQEYIRGAFVEDHGMITELTNTTRNGYQIIEQMGGNHVWYLDHYFQTDNNKCKTMLQKNIEALKQTKLQFHFTILPFVKIGGTSHLDNSDPTDPSYKEWILTHLKEIITLHPEIKGISLNDYYYPDKYWKTTTTAERDNNRKTLIDFAKSIRDFAHENNKIFSINLIDPQSHDAYAEDLAPLCDYIIPEIYRGMGRCPAGISLAEQHEWYKETLDYYLTKTGSTPILPSYITYDNYKETGEYPNEPEYTTADIMKDLDIIFKYNTAGYVMCEYGYCPHDITLPGKEG